MGRKHDIDHGTNPRFSGDASAGTDSFGEREEQERMRADAIQQLSDPRNVNFILLFGSQTAFPGVCAAATPSFTAFSAFKLSVMAQKAMP